MKYGILINKRNYSCSWNITVDRGYHHYQYRNYSCLRKGKKKVLEASIEVEAASSSNVLDDTILYWIYRVVFSF